MTEQEKKGETGERSSWSGVISSASAGFSHCMMVTGTGDVCSTGWNLYGQLGHAVDYDMCVPRCIQGFKEEKQKVSAVSGGWMHSMALTVKGQVYTWGNDKKGQCGHNGEHADSSKQVPRIVSKLQNEFVECVDAGREHSAAVTAAGKVYVWGAIPGYEEIEKEPLFLFELQDKIVKSVSCGWYHTGVLTEEGLVYMWGNGSFGRLGLGREANERSPTLVESLYGKRVAVLSCGFSHSAVALDDGSLYTWGSGAFGQLGHGSETSYNTPHWCDRLKSMKVVAVSCGFSHTLASTDEGELYAWGSGEFGKLGLGSEEGRSVPTHVHACRERNIRSVSAGWNFSLVVTATGEVLAWGQGECGQIGNGSVEDITLPSRMQLSDINCTPCREDATELGRESFPRSPNANARKNTLPAVDDSAGLRTELIKTSEKLMKAEALAEEFKKEADKWKTEALKIRNENARLKTAADEAKAEAEKHKVELKQIKAERFMSSLSPNDKSGGGMATPSPVKGGMQPRASTATIVRGRDIIAQEGPLPSPNRISSPSIADQSPNSEMLQKSKWKQRITKWKNRRNSSLDSSATNDSDFHNGDDTPERRPGTGVSPIQYNQPIPENGSGMTPERKKGLVSKLKRNK